MTENTPSTATADQEATANAADADGDEAVAPPAGLHVEEPDELAYAERTYVHDDDDYCARETQGRVVVGVTNDDGEVLLLVNDDHSHAILPNCHVEDGDWVAVARETVAESTGVAVDLEGPEAVRAVDHEVEGDDAHDRRTHHVVYRATPQDDAGDGGDVEPACDDPDWRAGWFAEIPYEIDEEHGDVLDDIERFLE